MEEKFENIDRFVDGLNAYTGDDIWDDLILRAEIEGDAIDVDRCIEGDGNAVYLKSNKTIFYREDTKEWEEWV